MSISGHNSYQEIYQNQTSRKNTSFKSGLLETTLLNFALFQQAPQEMGQKWDHIKLPVDAGTLAQPWPDAGESSKHPLNPPGVLV